MYFESHHIKNSYILVGKEMRVLSQAVIKALLAELQIRGGTDDNSKIIIFISQRKHIL